MVLVRLFRFTYTSVPCHRYNFSPLSFKVVDMILEGVFEKPHNSSMQKYIHTYNLTASLLHVSAFLAIKKNWLIIR
jgi:hypothetical protein